MVMAEMMNSQTNWLESASPTPATPPQPSQHPYRYDHHRVQNDTCYNCRQRGHWANRCPLKTPSPSSSSNPNTSESTPFPFSSSPIPLSHCYPAISCPHCQATCTVNVSQSERNPRKKYYKCPREKNGKSEFFRWCDDVIDDWDRLPSSEDRPSCKCRAGPCRLMLEVGKELNISPRYYFVCPIEKGHGACNFRLYLDDISAAVDTMNGDLHEGGELSFRNSKKRKLEPLVLHLASPETIEDVGETFIDREENELTPNLSTLQDIAPLEGESLDFIMEKASQVSSLSSRPIRHRQAEFRTQMSAAGDISIADPISQFLGHHLLGWLGRLAFPPSRCLSDPPSRPFLCCVFPSFNPIYVPKDVAVTDSEYLNGQPNSPSNTESDLSRGTQCSNGVLLELSSLNNPGTRNIQQGTNGDGQNLEALGQVVLHCQNHLLSRLESMSLVDSETVIDAERQLDAVSRLLAGYATFSERVRKFIACASLLAEIEKSINMDASMQELRDRYEIEKIRHDSLHLSHAQMVDDIANSDKRLEQLRGEALRLKEMLTKIENKVNDGEAENRNLKRRKSEISKDMLECVKKMKGASEELELAKEREVARCAAKVALEEARSQLRQ